MTDTVCKACARPVGDGAVICQVCTDRLARDLGDLGNLAAEIETTRLRQSRMGGAATGVLSRSSDKPLPWDQRAAETADLFRSTLVAWVGVAVAESGVQTPPDTIAAMSTALLDLLPWLRQQEWADEMADEVDHVCAQARAVIDRRGERTWAGPCRSTVEAEDGDWCCTADLYPYVDRPRFRCPECSTDHDLPARKRWLLAMAEGQLATVAELCAIVRTADDLPLTRHVVNGWVRRGRLVQHGVAEPALYRIGDVVELLVVKRMTA